MANSEPEWVKFKVGKPSMTPGWIETPCQELTTVSHVAHVNTALDIVRDGKIKPSVIFDKSKLNTDRILVVWVSPNRWKDGSRYGNVEMVFDWRSLVEGKKYYWVESIAYTTPACRILVTDIDHSHESEKLQEYNPQEGNGPWWYDSDTDQHYWNGKHCLEIMLERELPLTELSRVDFVQHHSHQCCISPESCRDKGHSDTRGGAHFLAGLAALGLKTESLKLTQERDGELIPSDAALDAWKKLERELIVGDLNDDDLDFDGQISYDNQSQSDSISRAVLSAYWRKNQTEQRTLSQLFASKDDMIDSCERLMSNMLGVKRMNNDDDEE